MDSVQSECCILGKLDQDQGETKPRAPCEAEVLHPQDTPAEIAKPNETPIESPSLESPK